MSPETNPDAFRASSPPIRVQDARKNGTCDRNHRHGKIKLISIFDMIRIIDTI